VYIEVCTRGPCVHCFPSEKNRQEEEGTRAVSRVHGRSLALSERATKCRSMVRWLATCGDRCMHPFLSER
jgi:hypothetical protein